MVLKKKTSGANDSRAEQLAFLKANAKDLSKAAKKDAPTGYTTAPDIIKAFGLKMDKAGKSSNSSSTQAKLVRIRSGMFPADPKKKTKAAMWVSFDFTCVGSTGKGQTPGIMITIAERKFSNGDTRGKDKAFDDIMFTLQRCGIDTRSIKNEADLLDLIDEYNAKDRADKAVVSVTLTAYSGAKGPGVNVKVNKLLEDFEEEDAEDGEEDEDEDDESDSDDDESGDSDDEDEDEAEDDEKPSKSKSAKSSKSTKSKSKSKSDDDDDDEEEEDEDAEEDSEDEEEEDEVEYDEEDPSTWVGYECTAKPNGYAKKTKFEITEYIAKGKKLKIKDPKGKVVTVAATVVTVA